MALEHAATAAQQVRVKLKPIIVIVYRMSTDISLAIYIYTHIYFSVSIYMYIVRHSQQARMDNREDQWSLSQLSSKHLEGNSG